MYILTLTSIRAVRLSARYDVPTHLAAQREADGNIKLGVNQCVECGIAGVKSHDLQSLCIIRVEV